MTYLSATLAGHGGDAVHSGERGGLSVTAKPPSLLQLHKMLRSKAHLLLPGAGFKIPHLNICKICHCKTQHPHCVSDNHPGFQVPP